MLDAAQIARLLPHGHPMLLVDRVVALTPGRSIVALKAITVSEPCFRALGPGAPAEHYAFPASLLLESFGQSAALLWLHGDRRGVGGDELLMLLLARNCRIEGCAMPGDVLRHAARIEQVVGDHVVVAGETFVGDRRVATVGSMLAGVRKRTAVDGAAGARAAAYANEGSRA